MTEMDGLQPVLLPGEEQDDLYEEVDPYVAEGTRELIRWVRAQEVGPSRLRQLGGAGLKTLIGIEEGVIDIQKRAAEGIAKIAEHIGL